MDKTTLYLLGSTFLLATTYQSVVASEADYQAEIGYQYTQIDYDDTPKTEETIHTINFEYFLNPIEISNQPLVEAAFMNRVGSITVGYSLNDIESNTQTGDANFTTVQYNHMQQGSPLLLQVLYQQGTADFDIKDGSFIDYSYDRTQYGISIGAFIAQNTTIAFAYIQQEVEYSPAVYTDNDYTLTSTNIVAKHLMPTGNGTMLNIEGLIGLDSYDNKGAADTENTVLGISGDYYLNNMLSFGATLIQVSGDDNEYKGQNIAVEGRYFLTPKFSLAAQISQFAGDGKSDDEDAIAIDASLRF